MNLCNRESFRKAVGAFCEAATYRWIALVAVGTIALTSLQSRAQSYTLDWWDVSAGSTSSGGIYSLSGSIGQPDAGSLNGGQYILNGGFWATVAQTQTPMIPPRLTLTATSTNTVVLSWPSQSTGFVVQEGTDLKTQSWSNAGLTPTDDGTTSAVVLPLNSGTRFYRLKK